MTDNLESEEFEEIFEENDENDLYINSIVFLVDATPDMHKDNRFISSIETYKNIIRYKCSFNRTDKMGLVIFGTKETNCQIDNVTVLQEFDSVTLDTLKQIHSILNSDIDKYKKLASDSKYPLYDALFHVFQMLHTSKTNMNTHNTIVLCTSRDDPCSEADNNERRRIEHLVSTFKDSETNLIVVGLSPSWDDNLYYKDLQIISGTFSNDNYKRILLNDLEETILNRARSVGRLSWKISPNICIEVSLFNLISTPKYPMEKSLHKDNNEVLETHSYFVEVEDSSIEDSEESETKREIVPKENIIYYESYGGIDIFFQPDECKKMKNLGLETGIEILTFKPIVCNPLYHMSPPYFVTYTDDCTHESKLFFMAFISKCYKKKVMPICKVVTSSTILIAMMIPSEDDGGFYMNTMPFKDNIRDYDDCLQEYIFSSKCEHAENEEVVDNFKKLMTMLEAPFNPKLFKNPKLEKTIAYIEALALDQKVNSLPPDATLPPPIKDDVVQLANTLTKLLGLEDIEPIESSNKRPSSEKNTTVDKKRKLDIKSIIQSKKLHTLTVADLREVLQDIKLSTQGNKSNLIQRIYEYYEK